MTQSQNNNRTINLALKSNKGNSIGRDVFLDGVQPNSIKNDVDDGLKCQHTTSERLKSLEEEVCEIRECVLDLITIIRGYEKTVEANTEELTALRNAHMCASSAGRGKPEPTSALIQLDQRIPYKMIGQFFSNEDKKTASIPVYKLELYERGQSVSGKDKRVKYQDVHCGLYNDFGLAELKKLAKLPINKPHSSDVRWMEERIDVLNNEAAAGFAPGAFVGGFFKRHKTQEIFCNVVFIIDLEDMTGTIFLGRPTGEVSINFTMVKLKNYEKANRSAEYINYFNVKDIRGALGGGAEGDDGDGE